MDEGIILAKLSRRQDNRLIAEWATQHVNLHLITRVKEALLDVVSSRIPRSKCLQNFCYQSLRVKRSMLTF